MKVVTPEISWHGKDAIFSIDIQSPIIKGVVRIVTAGLDSNVRVWQLKNSEIKFLSNLSRHEKAVNVVRFSKKNSLIASGGDDGTIVLWKLTDKEDVPSIFDCEEGGNVEVWNAFKSLRGHLEDINDLSWSNDDLHLVSGSVDHTAVLWDVEKGQKLSVFNDSKHFINGVAWDPLNSYVATMSSDRSLRIYNLQSKKLVHCITKITYTKSELKSNEQVAKPQRIFHDETVVRRRLAFTVDGKLLITPAGCLLANNTSSTINTTMIFSRNTFSKPCVYLPGLQEPASVVACCPILFELRNEGAEKESMFKLDYRHIFAVASSDTVLLYDTQQSTPFGLISNIHYASITDLSWCSDASFLAVSSRDGFCSIIFFEPNELGKPCTAPVNKVSVEIEEPMLLSSEQKSLKTNIVSELNSAKEMNKNKNKENFTQLMDIDENFHKQSQNSEELNAVEEATNKDTCLDKITNHSTSRRIVLETVSAIPGGKSPLIKKKNSANSFGNAPRRVQLVPVSK